SRTTPAASESARRIGIRCSGRRCGAGLSRRADQPRLARHDVAELTPRATSELLLVGSLPADSTEAAFRAGAEHFGDLVFALPDGETGPRAAWVGYERERLARPNSDVVVVEETASPTGIPRHAYETPVFAIREGVEDLRWESWPRIDDAI